MRPIFRDKTLLWAALMAVLGSLVYLTGFMNSSFLYSGMGYIGGDWPQPIPNIWHKTIVSVVAALSISGFVAGIWGGMRSRNWRWILAGLLLAALNIPFILRSGLPQYVVREMGVCEVKSSYPWGVSQWCKWKPL